MSSPTRNKYSSPIRNLDHKSPQRKLPIIHEQINQSLSDNKSLLRFYASGSSLKPTAALNFPDLYEIQRLREQLLISQKDNENLMRQLQLMGDHYMKKNSQLQLENQALKNELRLLTTKNSQQIDILRIKYDNISAQDLSLAKKTYVDDISRLLGDLQTVKSLLLQKQKQIEHLTKMMHGNSQDYSSNLERLITENNILRSQIVNCEINKNQQIKNVETKKQLEKSRTRGIINYSKESNAYMEKQLNRLAGELVEKNVNIQSFTKQILKLKKQHETTTKQTERLIESLKTEHAKQLSDKTQSFMKTQKRLKQQLLDSKANQMNLLEKLASMENVNEILKKQQNQINEALMKKKQQMNELRQSMTRLQDQHAKQIQKVMSDSRIKRKSMKNISSMSSFKDFESSDVPKQSKSSVLQRKESISNNQSGVLPVVKQQYGAMSVMSPDDDEQHEVKQLVFHYQQIINQLKKNKVNELQIANSTIEKLKSNIKEKQQEVLDLLARFSPLMELKINGPSIEEFRKQKIKQHYKADLDILSVMLDKYQIASLRKYR